MKVTEFSGVTIVSALFNGVGVTLGLNLKMEVEITPGTGKISGGLEDTEKVLDFVFKRERINREDFNVTIRSEIPHSVGLKSSSSFILALLIAIHQLKGPKIDDTEIIIKSCRYSKEIGISYTGAMDDAVAVHYGGLNFVDNIGYKLLSQYGVIPQDILVSVPIKRKKRVSQEEIKYGIEENRVALRLAQKLEFGESALLNSQAIANVFGYDIGIINDLRKLDGVKLAGFSGTGPAFYAIYQNKGNPTKEIEDYFRKFGDFINGRIR